jgi:hypothetical protein
MLRDSTSARLICDLVAQASSHNHACLGVAILEQLRVRTNPETEPTLLEEWALQRRYHRARCTEDLGALSLPYDAKKLKISRSAHSFLLTTGKPCLNIALKSCPKFVKWSSGRVGFHSLMFLRVGGERQGLVCDTRVVRPCREPRVKRCAS